MQDMFNYKHLKYFWCVAHEGSIAKASEKLNVTPQTISGQLSLLEQRINASLFEKQGRGLRLTHVGKVVLRYADEIFELGFELTDVLKDQKSIGPTEFIVSATSGLPKTLVYKVIEPATDIDRGLLLSCLEGPVDEILGELAVHKIDLVLSDIPVTGALSLKAYNHLLGQSELSFFASPKLAREYKSNFPQSLNNAPLLVPTSQHETRKEFDVWLSNQNIRPNIVAQFDDSALLKSFAQAGLGIFFMPEIISHEICETYNVRKLGTVAELKQKIYAISAERKISHPAIAAICESAKEVFKRNG